MGGAEPEEPRLFVFGQLVVGLLASDHRGKDRNSLLALADIPPKLEPGVESGDVRRFGTLAVDQEAVAPTVLVETGHHAQVGLERVALAAFERFHEPRDGRLAESLGLFRGHISYLLCLPGEKGGVRPPPPRL